MRTPRFRRGTTQGRERVQFQGLADFFDLRAVLSDAIKQFALGLNACAEKKGGSLRTASEKGRFNQLVEGSDRSIGKADHDDVSAGRFPTAEAREQFLQFRKGREREGGHVRFRFTSHDNYT